MCVVLLAQSQRAGHMQVETTCTLSQCLSTFFPFFFATPTKRKKSKKKKKKSQMENVLSNSFSCARLSFIVFFSLSGPCPPWTIRIDCPMIVQWGQCIMLEVKGGSNFKNQPGKNDQIGIIHFLESKERGINNPGSRLQKLWPLPNHSQ